jgi:hypothetical protein
MKTANLAYTTGKKFLARRGERRLGSLTDLIVIPSSTKNATGLILFHGVALVVHRAAENIFLSPG